jgi:meso-butanediol dehydrogenase / (S,S)-butanediol dehydrogenase / diacetyl reductase
MKIAKTGSKVVMVTGGANGIGLAVSRLLVDQGSVVGIIDRDAAALDAIQNELHDSIQVYHADVKDRSAVKNALLQLHQLHGQLDGMFNNAGIYNFNSLMNITEQQWSDTMDNNALGTLIGIQEAARIMIASGKSGKIVNTASVSGIRGYSNSIDYCASKSAVISITETAAIELAPHGIAVNCISPGIVRTGLQERINNERHQHGVKPFLDDPNAPNVLTLTGKHTGHWAEPDDIAALVAFLFSNGADYITGQNYVIDGGMLLA